MEIRKHILAAETTVIMELPYTHTHTHMHIYTGHLA